MWKITRGEFIPKLWICVRYEPILFPSKLCPLCQNTMKIKRKYIIFGKVIKEGCINDECDNYYHRSFSRSI